MANLKVGALDCVCGTFGKEDLNTSESCGCDYEITTCPNRHHPRPNLIQLLLDFQRRC